MAQNTFNEQSLNLDSLLKKITSSYLNPASFLPQNSDTSSLAATGSAIIESLTSNSGNGIALPGASSALSSSTTIPKSSSSSETSRSSSNMQRIPDLINDEELLSLHSSLMDQEQNDDNESGSQTIEALLTGTRRSPLPKVKQEFIDNVDYTTQRSIGNKHCDIFVTEKRQKSPSALELLLCKAKNEPSRNGIESKANSLLSSALTSTMAPVSFPQDLTVKNLSPMNLGKATKSELNSFSPFLKLNSESSNDGVKSCDYCTKKFENEDDLISHLKEVHAIVDSFSPEANTPLDSLVIASPPNGDEQDSDHVITAGESNGLKRRNDESWSPGSDGTPQQSGSRKIKKYDVVISNAKSSNSINWVAEVWNTWIRQHDNTPNFSTANCDFENVFHSRLSDLPDLLTVFVKQCRKPDGKEYPLRMLYSIFSIMQMHINNQKIPLNIFKDPKYANFQRALHEKMKPISRTMTAKSSVKTGVITEDLEKQLWDRGVLSIEDPTNLLRTVFFLVGKHFNLGSRQEHRNLRSGFNSQIKVVGSGDDERIEFHEDGLFGREFNNIKRPTIHKKEGPNCAVEIIKFYLSKLPKYAVAFYCKPKTEYFHDNDWYYNQPIGVNTLSKIVESIARDAGWDTSLNWAGAYVCSICQRSFRFQCNLSYHMKFHFMDKPHKCNLCFKGFASKTLLWSHKKEVHKTDVHNLARPKRSSPPNVSVSSSSTLSSMLVSNKNQKDTTTPPPNVISTSLPNNSSQSTVSALNLSGNPNLGNQQLGTLSIPTITTNHQITTGDIYSCFKCSAKFSSAHQMITHLENHIVDLEKRLNLSLVANNGVANRALVVSSMAPPITRPTDKIPNVISITPINNPKQNSSPIPQLKQHLNPNSQKDLSPNVQVKNFSLLESTINGLLDGQNNKANSAVFEETIDADSIVVKTEVSPGLQSSSSTTLLLCPVLCPCGPCDEVFSTETDLKDHVKNHSMIADSSKCRNCHLTIIKNEDSFTLEKSGKPKVTFDLSKTANSSLSLEESEILSPTNLKTESEPEDLTVENTGTVAVTQQAPPVFNFQSSLPSMVVSSSRLGGVPIFDMDETEETENRYQCEKCDLSFPDRFRLSRHRRKHSRDERLDPKVVNGTAFMCTICSIPFRCENDLTVHESWHDCGEPLQCEFCGVILSSRLSLKRHVIHVHVMLKPHKCNACNASFERSSHLSKHKREAHGL